MDSILRKGLFLVTFSGAIAAFPTTAHAAEAEVSLPKVGIEEVLSNCYSSEKEIQVEDYLVPTEKGEYLDMAFADVQTFLYIRSEPTKESEWVGKLYPDNAALILGPVGEWTQVKSGDVSGYVCSEYITIGKNAQEKAQEIIAEKQTETADIAPEEAFTYAESKAEEEARLAREEEERRQKAEEEAEARAGTGQAVVDYAKQFLGNPYVWGGTSLTNGADCSGFVQSVFRHFGINLPRTSGEMRGSGQAVSYSEAIPGDIICYDGHVGIYAGNGEIVNALNRKSGIVMTSATYTNIITVRRLL